VSRSEVQGAARSTVARLPRDAAQGGHTALARALARGAREPGPTIRVGQVRTARGRFAPKQHPVVMTEGVAFAKDSAWCDLWVQWYVLVTNPRSVRG
jgi:hypothetical protein